MLAWIFDSVAQALDKRKHYYLTLKEDPAYAGKKTEQGAAFVEKLSVWCWNDARPWKKDEIDSMCVSSGGRKMGAVAITCTPKVMQEIKREFSSEIETVELFAPKAIFGEWKFKKI